jgi:hypothetical protein
MTWIQFSRLAQDDVTFVLAHLFFLEQRLKCKAKSWCLDVENLEIPRLHGLNRMPEQEDIS